MERPTSSSGDNLPGTSSGRRPRRKNNTVNVVAALCYVLAAAFAAAMLGLGFESPDSTLRQERRMTGYIGILMVLTVGPGVVYLARRKRDDSRKVLDSIERLCEEVRVMSEQSCLSADARRVLNRKTERDLLYRAIEEDIQAEEWDAALVLVHELAERFGYRAEAEEFRARIHAARETQQDRDVADAIARLDGLIVQRRWDVALREAGRIGRLYPDSPRVENLRERVVQARGVYRADLERRLVEAASAGRTDEGMTLLKELDTYLSPEDAEPFREMARGIISKARENLGAQFKLAVQDRRWGQAAAVGRRIINEFPNTKMADEVRAMLDGILQRANATGATIPLAASSENNGNVGVMPQPRG